MKSKNKWAILASHLIVVFFVLVESCTCVALGDCTYHSYVIPHGACVYGITGDDSDKPLYCSFLLGSPALINHCKLCGCPPGQRCMADENCVQSIQEYCESAYGFSYNLGSPDACEDPFLGKVRCEKLDGIDKLMCFQCKGDCELQKTTGDIKAIIYGVVWGIAALMFVINGIRLITSDDLTARENAKRAMIYIILAMIVITIAVEFVEYILG